MCDWALNTSLIFLVLLFIHLLTRRTPTSVWNLWKNASNFAGLVHSYTKKNLLFWNLVQNRMSLVLAFKRNRAWLTNWKKQIMLKKVALWVTNLLKYLRQGFSSLSDSLLPSIPKWKAFSVVILVSWTLRAHSSVWNLWKNAGNFVVLICYSKLVHLDS